MEVNNIHFVIGYFNIIMRGMRIVISTSKIRKIILIMKNWILKGSRFIDNGSNPHSNGVDFSWFQ